MTAPLFSDRQGYRPPPQANSDDYLPPWVRESVCNQLRDFTLVPPGRFYQPLDVYHVFRPYIWQVLNREPPGNPNGGPWAYYAPKVLRECEWWRLYDIVEEICAVISVNWEPSALSKLADRINPILDGDGIPWNIRDGKIHRRFNTLQTDTIKEVQNLLSQPMFRGPDQQFGKAVEHLNNRPSPDLENCVKDAVGALEALGNILSQTNGVQLNTLLKREPL